MEIYTIIKDIYNTLKDHRNRNDLTKKERIEKLFFPFYSDLIEVHKYYTSLFNELSDRTLSLSENFDSNDLESIKKDSIRMFDGSYKDFVKSKSFSLITFCKTDLEKKFTFCIIKYFLDHRGPTYSDLIDGGVVTEFSNVENLIDFVLLNNSNPEKVQRIINDHFDTPSSFLYLAIMGENDKEMVRSIILEKQQHLNNYMTLLSQTYIELQSSVLN